MRKHHPEEIAKLIKEQKEEISKFENKLNELTLKKESMENEIKKIRETNESYRNYLLRFGKIRLKPDRFYRYEYKGFPIGYNPTKEEYDEHFEDWCKITKLKTKISSTEDDMIYLESRLEIAKNISRGTEWKKMI